MSPENSNSLQVNFTALKNYKRTLSKSAGISSLIFVVMMLSAFTIVLWGTLPDAGHLFTVLLLSTILVLAVTIAYKVHKQSAKNKLYLQEFANQNGFTYIDKDTQIAEPGTLFDEGDNKRKRSILSGTLSGLEFQSYEYYYTTGSGKNRHENDAMVFEFTLPRVVPHFVIDSQLEVVLPILFDKSQKIELEGDFHKYFDLYAPDTYGISALTLLAPDAMEVLLEYAALCDVEIIQNKLYFYWSVPANNQAQYEKVFKTAHAVITKLKDKLTTDNIYASDSQARVHAVPSSQGVKLKRTSFNIYVTISIIVGYFAINILMNMHSLSKYSFLIYPIFFIGIFAWVFIGAGKQARLQKEYLSRYDLKDHLK